MESSRSLGGFQRSFLGWNGIDSFLKSEYSMQMRNAPVRPIWPDEVERALSLSHANPSIPRVTSLSRGSPPSSPPILLSSKVNAGAALLRARRPPTLLRGGATLLRARRRPSPAAASARRGGGQQAGGQGHARRRPRPCAFHSTVSKLGSNQGLIECLD